MQSRNYELIERVSKGDAEAMDELVSSNMGLVKSIAVKFRDRGVEYEDLLQIGTIGMIKAAKSFDFSYNTAFSTYAVPLIIGEIRRFLRDDGIIKVSREIKKQGITIMRLKETFIRDNGRDPRVSELSQLSGLSVEELVYALESVCPVHSLQESVGGDEDGMTLDSVIADNENAIDGLTDKLALSEAIKKLPKLEQQIILLRYFKDMSQQQTANILGLTQVKVSREEKKIFEFLRGEL